MAVLAAALAASVTLPACQRTAEETAEPDARPVHALTIEKQDAGDVVVLSGRIAAEDETAVAFRIPGRMIDRPVNVGDRVRKGQVLARLEQMNERNQLLAAQAALNAARAELVRSRDALHRQQSLIDEGFTTRANLDTATAAFRSGEAQVKSAQAQVQMAEDLVGFTVLVAEYDGRDNIFTPNSGLRAYLSAMKFDEALGSDHDFSRSRLGLNAYFPAGNSVVVGVRADAQSVDGDVPFYARPFIELRGIPAMRYQGDRTALVEIEGRWNLDGRWSLVGFAGAGRAADSSGGIGGAPTRVTKGVGFRYLVARALGLRAGLDVARGPEESAFYIVVGSYWR